MATDLQLKSWQCPAAATKEDIRIGWLNESCEEGTAWHRAQRGWGDYRKALTILAGQHGTNEIVAYRSQLHTNRLKRNIREVIGALANLRPIWGYASDNDAFLPQAEMMNKISRAIYLENFFDRSIKSALQWAASTNTGWVRPVFRRNMAGKGKGNFELLSYGSPCVLPVQLPSDGDFQEAYAVTLLDEMPIYMAHGMFPLFQDRLHPTSSQYWYSGEIRKAAQGNMMQRVFNVFGKRSRDTIGSQLFCGIRYTTVIDLTINTTGMTIPMGEPGTSWYYEVPSLGHDIPAGFDSNGQQLSRKATENDARLYPYRRLIISTEDCILYDGPAFNWHGEVDLIPFCMDDWAWEPLGFSLVRDGYDIQCSIDELMRGVMDKHRAQLDMPLGYDMNAVPKLQADQFDPMRPRTRIAFDGMSSSVPFQPAIPLEVLEVGAETMNMIDRLNQTMDYQLAVADIVAMAKARALGNTADLSEKLMEANGPVVRDISRSMERSLTAVGNQMKYLLLQYLDTKRAIQYVGEDGITPQVLDYDPARLIPSHLPDENPHDGTQKAGPSAYSQQQRARWFADNLRFFITPHSAHEITQMDHKLSLIELKKSGVWISNRTIAEAFDVPNYGNKPGGNTEVERYWAEQEMQAEHMLKVQALVASISGQGGPTVPGAGPPGGAPPPGAPNPSIEGAPEGRPPSFHAVPHIEAKDGGVRHTIATS